MHPGSRGAGCRLTTIRQFIITSRCRIHPAPGVLSETRQTTGKTALGSASQASLDAPVYMAPCATLFVHHWQHARIPGKEHGLHYVLHESERSLFTHIGLLRSIDQPLFAPVPTQTQVALGARHLSSAYDLFTVCKCTILGYRPSCRWFGKGMNTQETIGRCC